MALTLTQYLAESTQRDGDTSGIETCSTCHIPLQEAITGYRRVGDGAKCADCYFCEISKMIDQHPIGRPMATRTALATSLVVA